MIFYDSVYVTNIPSFYKLNLYNRIAKRKGIFVIFTGEINEVRNDDFFRGDFNFDFINLSGKQVYCKIWIVTHILRKCNYGELVLGGWDSIIMWWLLFVSPRSKNSLIVESSYLESNIVGIKCFLKKLFLQRISKAYVPGKSNRKLLEILNFRRRIIETRGVGIFNIIPQPLYTRKEKINKFLYVGRLSPEKNVEMLVRVFNKRPDLILNIVGFGPSEEALKRLAKKNIVFHGPINNEDLPNIYQSNDVFILPSLSETWGLVVEEVLNNGLPVIVSNKVGCAEEIVNENNGIVFSLDSDTGLLNAIDHIRDVSYYNSLRCYIASYNFNSIAENQVTCYL